MIKKILFLCKYNRFRSKVAEAIFKKLNKNKKIKAKSAGIIKGYPISKEIISIAKDYGIIIGGKPRGLSAELLNWGDIVIIVSDDIPSSLLTRKYIKKKLIWKIKDTDGGKIAMQKVIKLIEKKVKYLIKKLR